MSGLEPGTTPAMVAIETATETVAMAERVPAAGLLEQAKGGMT